MIEMMEDDQALMTVSACSSLLPLPDPPPTLDGPHVPERNDDEGEDDDEKEEEESDSDEEEEEGEEKCLRLLSSLLPSSSSPGATATATTTAFQEATASPVDEDEHDDASSPSSFALKQQQQRQKQQQRRQERQTQQKQSEEEMDPTVPRLRPAVPPKPGGGGGHNGQMDAVRYSMHNLKESSKWELDALLEELESLEQQFSVNSNGQTDANGSSGLAPIPTSLLPTSTSTTSHLTQASTSSSSSPEWNGIPSGKSASAVLRSAAMSAGIISCQSPDADGDSAFGEGSSSTEGLTGRLARSSIATGSNSSAAGSSASSTDSCRHSLHTPSPTQQASPPQQQQQQQTQQKIAQVQPTQLQQNSLQPADHEEAQKQTKIREALEKMRDARIQRVFVKFFVDDGQPLQMLVDERWTVAETMRQICEKHQLRLHTDHCIVEELPELWIRRIYEDHEMLVENIQLWLQDSQNKLYFVRRPDKYAFMERPELYLVTAHTADIDLPANHGHWTLDEKQALVRAFFDREPVAPPQLEGVLQLKADGRKTWRKTGFLLRHSGLYAASGKAMKKAAEKGGGAVANSKDLQCVMAPHSSQAYMAFGWRKKYKAPTEHGIAVKLTALQRKNSHYIKYVCAADEADARKWLVGLRIAKNGRALYDNFVAALQRSAMATVPGVIGGATSTNSLLTPLKVIPSSTASSRLDLQYPANNHHHHHHHQLHPEDRRSAASTSSSSQPHSPAAQSIRTVNSAGRPSAVFFESSCDGAETGTIKRQPHPHNQAVLMAPPANDVVVMLDEDVDSDEDDDLSSPHPFDDERLPPPPPPPPLPPQTAPPVRRAVAFSDEPRPSTLSAASSPRKVPPPPPRRSEATRLTTVVQADVHVNAHSSSRQPASNQGVRSELEAALGRQRQRIGHV